MAFAGVPKIVSSLFRSTFFGRPPSGFLSDADLGSGSRCAMLRRLWLSFKADADRSPPFRRFDAALAIGTMSCPQFRRMFVTSRPDLSAVSQIDERTALRFSANRSDEERFHRESIGFAHVLDQLDPFERLTGFLGIGDDPPQMQIATIFAVMSPTIALSLADVARRAIGSEKRINVEGQQVHVVFQF